MGKGIPAGLFRKKDTSPKKPYVPVSREEALTRMLDAYSGYYNINRETPAAPFDAEAEFRLHDEQYFLFKAARLSEADSGEIVFFSAPEKLSAELFGELSQKAWEEGLGRVDVKPNHRSTDILLYVLAEHAEPAAKELIRSTKLSKTYQFGFRGYSHFRAIALDLSDGSVAYNRMGEPLGRIIHNIFKMS